MIKNKLQFGLLALAVFAVLGLAVHVNAAALTWSADQTVDLSSPDINLTIVSGSEATSLVVGAESIAVVVASGDTFTITSADRELEVTGVTTSGSSSTCTSGTSTATINGGPDGETITISPGNNQCSSGSGGGGGGGGSKKATTPAVIPATPAPILVFCPVGQMYDSMTGQKCNSTISTPGASGYALGTTLVKMGTRGEACKAWQMFFNTKRNAGLATDGVCGPLSMAAARAWQSASSLTADGLLGPASRAKAMTQ